MVPVKPESVFSRDFVNFRAPVPLRTPSKTTFTPFLSDSSHNILRLSTAPNTENETAVLHLTLRWQIAEVRVFCPALGPPQTLSLTWLCLDMRGIFGHDSAIGGCLAS